MTPGLLRFIRVLREEGLLISIQEGLDAAEAVSRVGLQDRALLRLSLRTVLVKTRKDYAPFDRLFDRFFSYTFARKEAEKAEKKRPGDSSGENRNRASSQRKGEGSPSQAGKGRPAISLRKKEQRDRPSPAEKKRGEPRESSERPAEARAFLPPGSDEEPAKKGSQEPEAGAPEQTARRLAPQEQLRELNRDYPPDALADMYEEVEQLAARLLMRRAVRTKHAQRGRPDIRRRVTRGLRGGIEVPFTLAHRRRAERRLDLVVLCDVSGSVWKVSTFLLKLVRTLQSAFCGVRSFVFVNSIVEVTDRFSTLPFPDGLKALKEHPGVDLFGLSDFGRVLYQFRQDAAAWMNRDTVVLIIGDARANNLDAQAWALEEIRQSCRSIIWLNPEPRKRWNTGDSVIREYGPYCDHVLECWALEHLGDAAEALLRA